MENNEPKGKNNYKVNVALHLLIAFYSFSGVCSKMASRQTFLSPRFCLYYAGLIAILGVYAIAWQQIIKRMPLTFAYANKSVGIIWTMIWGILFFNEVITINKFIGSIIVMIGTIMYSKGESHEH